MSEYGSGWEVLATSVPAHIAFGTVLGLLLERYTKHKGWIWPLAVEALDGLRSGASVVAERRTGLKRPS